MHVTYRYLRFFSSEKASLDISVSLIVLLLSVLKNKKVYYSCQKKLVQIKKYSIRGQTLRQRLKNSAKYMAQCRVDNKKRETEELRQVFHGLIIVCNVK